MLRYIEVRSRTRTEFVDITDEVRELVKNAGVRSGLCHLFVLHTTAGLTINEGADPAVQRDIITFLNQRVPADFYYTHGEGNSDAHIKSTLVGTSQLVPIDGGKLVLGSWQAIYLCEFDGPRPRRIAVQLLVND
ncbi:MAG TPA: secondary thiamine-phosphate synthase enzyme YjbQ [Geobacteraceae bacterium]